MSWLRALLGLGEAVVDIQAGPHTRLSSNRRVMVEDAHTAEELSSAMRSGKTVRLMRGNTVAAVFTVQECTIDLVSNVHVFDVTFLPGGMIPC